MAFTMTSDRIMYSFDNYRHATDGINDCGFYEDKYEKMLTIIIPGEPIADGRIRTGEFSHYNPNKEALSKLFKVLYNVDPVLKRTMITGPHCVYLKAYYRPIKEYALHFANNKYDLEDIDAIGLKDNDNLEKIHWDVLQDDKFMIILDDDKTTKNITEKYYSINPRVEIRILYTDNYLDIYKQKIIESAKYMKYKCTKKFCLVNNLTLEHWHPRIFMETIMKWKYSRRETLIKFLEKDLVDINMIVNYINETEIDKIQLTKFKNRNIEIFVKYIENKRKYLKKKKVVTKKKSTTKRVVKKK
jgi:hypothetical protein